MRDFVTVDQAKAHIYMIGSEDDPTIQGYITAASRAVQNYLKSSPPWAREVDSNNQPVTDSSGAPAWVYDSSGDKVVDPVVQQATLVLVGYFFKNRDENPDNAFQQGYLPAPVTALLYPLRTPAVA